MMQGLIIMPAQIIMHAGWPALLLQIESHDYVW